MRVVHFVVALAAVIAGAIVLGTPIFSDESKPENSKRLLVESIQPDYAKWNSIKVGMTEAEVREILGKPIYEGKIPKERLNDPSWLKELIFGRIKFDSPSMPDSFEFYMFIRQGKVNEIRHPFDGDLSRDGEPTSPKPIYPRDRAKFDHYPRFVDLRWSPSSGKYPIEYIVEVERSQYEVPAPGENATLVGRPWKRIESELPYAAIAFGGKCPGRWRAKAKNEIGESEWSEWRQFQFEQ
jgi:hypothetical protein